MEMVRVCISGVEGPGGMYWQSRDLAGLSGLRGLADKAEIMQGWGAQPSETELLQAGAGLGVMAQRNRDHAYCISSVADLGACTGRAEIVQGSAGLRGSWPGGDHKCLWIPSLKGSSHRDPAVVSGGNLG
jgi:hypothetical protein